MIWKKKKRPAMKEQDQEAIATLVILSAWSYRIHSVQFKGAVRMLWP